MFPSVSVARARIVIGPSSRVREADQEAPVSVARSQAVPSRLTSTFLTVTLSVAVPLTVTEEDSTTSPPAGFTTSDDKKKWELNDNGKRVAALMDNGKSA